MLTDTALRNLKPKSKPYKAFDRDGIYVTVSPTGTVTFRYDYRLNGLRETLTIGRYGPAGISLPLPTKSCSMPRGPLPKARPGAREKARETPARHRGACPRHRETRLCLRHPARREGAQPG